METFIYQRHRKSCGAACLKMALCHYQRKKDYKYLEEPSSSLTLKELIELGEKYGLYLKAYKAVSHIELKSNKKYPLLLVLNENGLTHMVYLYKRRGRRYYVFDPSKGKRRLSYEILSSIWSLTYLEAINVSKVPFKAKHTPLSKRITSIVDILLGILGLVSLFVGFYFVNSDGNFLIPLICFSSFSLLEIARRVHLVHAMRRFDKEHSYVLDKIPSYRREEPYKHYLNLKNIIFHKTSSLPISIVEILGLGVLFTLNDPIFGICLIGYFAFSMVIEYIHKRRTSSLIEKLEEDESSYLGGVVLKKERIKAVSLLEEGYHLANREAYKQYVYFALGLALSLICSLVSGHISLNYLLFTFMGILFLGEEWIKLLKALTLHDESEKEEAYFLGLKEGEKENMVD